MYSYGNRPLKKSLFISVRYIFPISVYSTELIYAPFVLYQRIGDNIMLLYF